MEAIKALIEMSHRYGSDPEFVLAGGGNTSYKTEDMLYVKGSGTALATISESGFVKMDRKKLSAQAKMNIAFYPAMKTFPLTIISGGMNIFTSTKVFINAAAR